MSSSGRATNATSTSGSCRLAELPPPILSGTYTTGPVDARVWQRTSGRVRDPPQFGTPAAEDAVERRAAYAFVRDGRGRFLAVQGAGGLFLPGGGCESGESPEAALARELREETGQDLVRLVYRSTAIQHFAADGVSYRMMAAFYAVVLGDQLSEPEEELLWVDPATGDDSWYHACHAWAVRREAAAPLPN